MPGKKPSTNGFWLFLKSLQQEARENGRVVSYVELQETAGTLWQQMSPEEKDEFRERGRAFRNSDNYHQARQTMRRPQTQVFANSNQQTVASTADPFVFEANERVAVCNVKFRQKREEDQKMLSLGLAWRYGDGISPNKEFFKKRFYVASVQYLYSYKNALPPVEIGLVAFTLERGIYLSEHYIFDNHYPPLSLEGQSKMHSVSTHNLFPLPSGIGEYLSYGADACGGMGEYNGRLTPSFAEIWSKIWKLTCVECDDIGQVLCAASDFNAVEYALFYLRARGERKGVPPTTQWSLKHQNITSSSIVCMEDMIYSLFTFANASTGLVDVERDFKERMCRYLTTCQTNCCYHEAQANENCALGSAKRACFAAIEMLNTVYNQFTIIPGQHVPAMKDPIAARIPRQSLPMSVEAAVPEVAIQSGVSTQRSLQQVDNNSTTLCASDESRNNNVTTSFASLEQPSRSVVPAQESASASQQPRFVAPVSVSTRLFDSNRIASNSVCHEAEAFTSTQFRKPTRLPSLYSPTTECAVTLPQSAPTASVDALLHQTCTQFAQPCYSAFDAAARAASATLVANYAQNVSSASTLVSAVGEQPQRKPLRKPKTVPSVRMAARLEQRLADAQARSSGSVVSTLGAQHNAQAVAGGAANSVTAVTPMLGPFSLDNGNMRTEMSLGGIGRSTQLRHLQQPILPFMPGIASQLPTTAVSQATPHADLNEWWKP